MTTADAWLIAIKMRMPAELQDLIAALVFDTIDEVVLEGWSHRILDMNPYLKWAGHHKGRRTLEMLLNDPRRWRMVPWLHEHGFIPEWVNVTNVNKRNAIEWLEDRGYITFTVTISIRKWLRTQNFERLANSAACSNVFVQIYFDIMTGATEFPGMQSVLWLVDNFGRDITAYVNDISDPIIRHEYHARLEGAKQLLQRPSVSKYYEQYRIRRHKRRKIDS